MGWLRMLVTLCLALLGSGCVLNGNVKAFRVGEVTNASADQHRVVGPFAGALDAGTSVAAKAKGATGTDAENTFQIVFDDAFFKYLPDFGGTNEVMVIFRFSEGPVHDPEKEVVKILGPMKQQADASMSSHKHMVSYGPKMVDGASVRVHIQIVEADLEESLATIDVLDFVTDLASPALMANPVTAGELKLTRDIATAVISRNDNDIVLDYTLEFLPYDNGIVAPGYMAQSENAVYLPLTSGTYGIIKEEAAAPIQTPFFFTSSASCGGNPIGMALRYVGLGLLDLVLLPVSVLAAPFDTPDAASIAPIKLGDQGEFDDGGGITWSTSTRTLMQGDTSYDRKTWLAFTILKGGDSSHWDEKEILRFAEKRVQDLLVGPSNALNKAGETAEDAAIKALEEMVDDAKEEAERRKGVRDANSGNANPAPVPGVGGNGR